ncbi:MAG: polyprenyl synthetase family protein [Candidatus Margulisbacteria bacterium]|nr:polyprenyl synthetase family protein [Candidatus Margulisiibacteriota bacterium]
MELKKYLKKKQQLVNKYLKQYLNGSEYSSTLGKSIKYSLLAPGKRIRPILTIATAEMLGKSASLVIPAACAIEMIHVYSLIHDDLPAMDDDDLRRGKPTNHKIFGEAIAILAGDTLQAEAFNIIVQHSNINKIGTPRILAVIKELSNACGLKGMAAGQALDLQAENKKIKLKPLRLIHELKTGKLLQAAIRVGAIIAGARPKELTALTQYAESLGVAFQIQDDLLDVFGDTKTLGKKAGADLKKNKATYPKLLGIKKTQELLTKEINYARNALKIFGKKGIVLEKILEYVRERKK